MVSNVKIRFDNLDELFQLAEDRLPEAEREGNVYASHPDKDEPDPVYWRDPIYTNESQPQLAGEVSQQEQYYNIHQYGDILRYLGKGIQQHDDLSPSGEVNLSESRHRMTGQIQLGKEFEPVDGDPHDLLLKFSSGHAGYFSTKYEAGAIRQICSNGMRGFVSDLSFEQTHQDSLNPGLAFHAVDTIVDGVDAVEQRIAQAEQQELMNMDEALLLLQDYGIGQYFEDPTSDLLNALHEEVDDPRNPSLKETYDAATRAITHYLPEEAPEYVEDDALERAAALLDQNGSLPDAEQLGERAVEKRVNQYVEQDEEELEPYWESEQEDVLELAEMHGVQA